ncbi:hypothetical protein PFISCL1PPCAC_106 [Pristionchus fissidentatus]|uniref:Uncharacterized protein n=1 Tax=Pristionchus fissidentatus TaxID=1538716 RepID=A0AAV5UP52_9BILA|nr:hypothetical protein PFISCL1PPCAC_106 [Pristionchus fissidentatus]
MGALALDTLETILHRVDKFWKVLCGSLDLRRCQIAYAGAECACHTADIVNFDHAHHVAVVVAAQKLSEHYVVGRPESRQKRGEEGRRRSLLVILLGFLQELSTDATVHQSGNFRSMRAVERPKQQLVQRTRHAPHTFADHFELVEAVIFECALHTNVRWLSSRDTAIFKDGVVSGMVLAAVDACEARLLLQDLEDLLEVEILEEGVILALCGDEATQRTSPW